MHVLCCQLPSDEFLDRCIRSQVSEISKHRHFTSTRIRTIIAKNIEYSTLFYWVLKDWWQAKLYMVQAEVPIQLSLLESFFFFLKKKINNPILHIYWLHLIVWTLPFCGTDSKGLKNGKKSEIQKEHPDACIVSHVGNTDHIFLQRTATLGI